MAVNEDDAVKTGTVERAPVQAPAVRKPNPLMRFLREVQVELKKTSWPTRDELTKFTVVVMLTIVVVALFLSLSDSIAQVIAAKMFGVSTPGVPR